MPEADLMTDESQLVYTELLLTVMGWYTLDPENPRHLEKALKMAGLKLVKESPPQVSLPR